MYIHSFSHSFRKEAVYRKYLLLWSMRYRMRWLLYSSLSSSSFIIKNDPWNIYHVISLISGVSPGRNADISAKIWKCRMHVLIKNWKHMHFPGFIVKTEYFALINGAAARVVNQRKNMWVRFHVFWLIFLIAHEPAVALKQNLQKISSIKPAVKSVVDGYLGTSTEKNNILVQVVH